MPRPLASILGLILRAAVIASLASCGASTSTEPSDTPSPDDVEPDKTYRVSGRVLDASGSGLGSVSVSLSRAGAPDQTATAGQDGSYAFPALAAGTYTVTPSMADYTFEPVFRQVTVSSADVQVDSFLGVPVAQEPAGTSVSGRVVDEAGNALPGIVVVLSGRTSEGDEVSVSAVTDAVGHYVFPDLAEGRYVATCTDEEGDRSFTVPAIVIPVGDTDVAVDDFSEGTPEVSPVFGWIRDANGDPLSGVTIRLSSPSTQIEVLTDEQGFYSFDSVPEEQFVLRPSREGYSFPAEIFSVTPKNDTGTAVADIAATQTTVDSYSISGRITDPSGSGLEGVRVQLAAAGFVDYSATDRQGQFRFDDIEGGTYEITPTHDEHSFVPLQLQVAVSGADADGQDFSVEVPTYRVVGRIVDDTGAGLSGVLVVLSDQEGTANWSATTGAQGDYEFDEIAAGPYELVPSRSGYRFAPEAQQHRVADQDVTTADFIATGEGTIVIDVPVPPDEPEPEEGTIVIDVPIPPDEPEGQDEGTIVIDVPVPPEEPAPDEDGN